MLIVLKMGWRRKGFFVVVNWNSCAQVLFCLGHMGFFSGLTWLERQRTRTIRFTASQWFFNSAHFSNRQIQLPGEKSLVATWREAKAPIPVASWAPALLLLGGSPGQALCRVLVQRDEFPRNPHVCCGVAAVEGARAEPSPTVPQQPFSRGTPEPLPAFPALPPSPQWHF